MSPARRAPRGRGSAEPAPGAGADGSPGSAGFTASRPDRAAAPGRSRSRQGRAGASAPGAVPEPSGRIESSSLMTAILRVSRFGFNAFPGQNAPRDGRPAQRPVATAGGRRRPGPHTAFGISTIPVEKSVENVAPEGGERPEPLAFHRVALKNRHLYKILISLENFDVNYLNPAMCGVNSALTAHCRARTRPCEQSRPNPGGGGEGSGPPSEPFGIRAYTDGDSRLSGSRIACYFGRHHSP